MEAKTMAEKVAMYEFLLEEYKREAIVPSLDACPYIVEVGILTVGCDENNVIIVERKYSPTTFSPSAVKKICAMKFTDGAGNRVEPKVYGTREWYAKEAELINDVLPAMKFLAEKEAAEAAAADK